MKLKAQLGDQHYELEIMMVGDRAMVQLENRRYEVDVRRPEADCYLLFFGNDIYDCRVGRSTSAREAFDVDMRNQTYSISIVDPKRLRGSQNSDKHQRGTAEIIAPMPGKIVKVSVEAGAAVEKGHGIIVVEAMKMQNEMKAPRAGIVVSINVAPGDTVNAGEVLAVIED